jgi:hypothetical protein
MPTSKAYTKFIGANGTNSSEFNFINQSSPAWVLTFVRWDVQDTLRAIPSTGTGTELLQVRQPLVVESDCVQVSVSVSKSNLTHSMQATLVETDVNYETAIHPGDFVFVNMLNWEVDARRIALIGRNNTIGPINAQDDGFKGIFKVQSVRKKLGVDANGTKRVFFNITGFAFTEFNNCIYFNPYLRRDNQGTDKDDLLFATNLGSDYAQLISPSSNPTCQDIIKLLIHSFIGVGVSDQGIMSVNGTLITGNPHFYIPQQVGTFLGVDGAKAAKDVYNYMFGIQQYAGSAHVDLPTGLNPVNLLDPIDRFYYTDTFCVGTSLLKAEYWNQQKAWGILNQYTNAPLNELFTCFRLSPEGSVMPTVVFRQIPFNTETFGQAPFDTDATVTKFLSLPRWKISTGLIISTDLGRDEAARINFVQYYAQPPSDVSKTDAYMSAQTASKNYVYDINDVTRSGLRPMVITTSFEDLTIAKDENIGKKCAYILGDCIIGEHLKMNGTIECVGIVDPIAVGDNLEYDGNVYHIEEVNHVASINPESGEKTFRTVLRISHGVSISSNSVAYAEMIHTNAYQDRKANFNTGNQSLPGVSEDQDTSYRPTNPAPTLAEINRNDRPFAQPGQVIKPIQETEDDSE